MDDKLSLEDQVRADRVKGLTYREIAKKRRLNFTQIKEILNSEDEYVLNKTKKQIEILEKESKRWEIRISGYKELFNEYWKAKPLFDALNKLKSMKGDTPFYVMEEWWDWMERSGLAKIQIRRFLKMKGFYLDQENEELDRRIKELNKKIEKWKYRL